jgi:hypothetical protein
MTSVLLDGEKKMELNIGLSETLGAHIGEKTEPSDSSEEPIISILRETAHGPCQPIPGLKTSEMKPNCLLKMLSPRLNSPLKNIHAKESLPHSFPNMSPDQDLTNTSTLRIFLKAGIGET